MMRVREECACGVGHMVSVLVMWNTANKEKKTQSSLHIYRFHTQGFNQLWIKST